MDEVSVLVVGSSNTDMVVQVHRLPKAGETVLGGQFVTAGGGKGANQAVAAARAGGQVTFIARIGSDAFGDRAVEGFAAEAINVQHIVRDRAFPSGVALIFVAKTGENCIAVASGANGQLTAQDIRKARGAFRRAGVLLAQLEVPLPTVQAAVNLAVAAGIPVMLNPAPARPLPAKLLKSVYLLTPNETEAEMLTGARVDNNRAAEKAAEKLLRAGVRNVIITLGARGAFVAGDSVRHWIPAFKVRAVDATAAGDIFSGTLAVALAEGKPLLDAARFASAAAAVSVTRLGAQPSAPRRTEIEKMLATAGMLKNRRQLSR
jgi:ribokinase